MFRDSIRRRTILLRMLSSFFSLVLTQGQMAILLFRRRFAHSRYYVSLLALLIIPAMIGAYSYSSGDPEYRQRQIIAYVAFDAVGPGSLADSSDPFPSFTAALTAGADELRIKIGTYTENVNVATGDVRFRSWNGVSGAGELLDVVDRVEIVGNLRMGQYSVVAANITLVGNGVTFAATSFTLENGTLDIGNNILNHHATNSISNLLFLRDQAEIVALDVGGKLTPELARIEVTGEEFARWFLEKFGAELAKILINQPEGTTLRIEALGNDRENEFTVNGYVQSGEGRIIFQRSIRVLTSRRGMLIEAGQLNSDGADVDIFGNLDILGFGELFTGSGDLDVGGNASNTGGTLSTFTGTARVSGDYFQDGGETSTTGGDFDVFGDFNMGDPVTREPSDGVFSLNFEGAHSVVGDFYVAEDDDPSEQPVQNENARNRYILGGTCSGDPADGGLFLNGNYHFEGTGDRFDDLLFPPEQQGLRGNVFFVGATEQTVWQRQDEDAYFCSVVIASTGDPDDGIALLSDVWQNDEGTLTLEHGIIDVGAESNDWIMFNTGIELNLVDRNNAASGEGVVVLGSRDSYINGEVDRRVLCGNSGCGVITGGYLFPVGVSGADGQPDVDFFRPLILQFPDDLTQSTIASVRYRGDLTADDLEFNEIEVDAEGGGTLTLDVVGQQFWQLEFDRIPSFDPNSRVEADGLLNVNDILSLRLIQWNCDGTNPRMAGSFEGDNPSSAMRVAMIDGAPSVSQIGIVPQLCQVLGIASEHAINPIGPLVSAQTDFSIVKTAEPSSVAVFGMLTYTLVATNNGPDAGSAVVTDVLPSDVSYQSHTGNCTIDMTTVTCTTGTLSLGESETFTIIVRPQVVGTTFNEASVTSVATATDPNANNDTNSANVTVVENTASEIESTVPIEYELLPNFPNPFNPSTTIRYDVPYSSQVRISIFDVAGREIKILVDEVKSAGRYEVQFDATSLSSGTYLYRMRAGSFTATQSLTVLK